MSKVSTYKCGSCHYQKEEDKFITKVLSVMYRPKYDDIQGFSKIVCPNCKGLITILMSNVNCSLSKGE